MEEVTLDQGLGGDKTGRHQAEGTKVWAGAPRQKE
jgi:hypothetical protein